MGCLLWLLQFLCFLLFFHLHFLATYSSSSMQLCPHDQTIALLQFKNNFSIKSYASSDCESNGITSYPKTDSWKEGTDCCSWDGVTCDSLTGHVIGLDLNCSWLSGPFSPNSSLFHLPHLKSLNLASNCFNNSRISPQFGWFASLTNLNLSNSCFSGAVPSQISHLSRLISLDLSSYYSELEVTLETRTLKGIIHNLTEVRELFLDNINMSSVTPDSLMNLSSSLTSLDLRHCQLRGNFPSNIFYQPKLQSLRLNDNNNLSGYFPKSNWSSPLELLDLSNTFFFRKLPDSIGNLESLKYLSLSRCDFTGSILSSIKNLRQLTHLDISYANFSGGLPKPIGYLESLKYLSLSGCHFTGSIPSSFKNLRQLTDLDLSYVNFSRGLPESIGYLESLKSLNLFQCNLIGSIPSSFKNLKQLTDLDLSFNIFFGGLLEPIGFLESLKSLDLFNCNFTGSIPSSLKNLKQLTYLDLASNDFTGPIPNFFDNLSKLTFLDLSGNNFGGQLPSSIFNLSQLERLEVSRNQLVGSIPYQVGMLSNLSYLDLSSNLLNGTIPSWLYTLPSLKELDLSNNQLTGHINEFFSKSLERIYLDNNKLHGPLPNSIFKLVNLTSLFISSNNLTGNVESDMFSNLNNLQYLDLSYNSLSFISANLHVNYTLPSLLYLNFSSCDMSEIPNFLRAAKNLLSLDLSNNKIDKIPKWMWDAGMDSLSYLNLSHNSLTSVQKLPWRNLGVLDLHSNSLQGPVPIPPLNPLEFFSISQNNLTGEIPSVICNASFLWILDFSHNNLSGMLPWCIGNFSERLSVLNLQMNNFHGTIPTAISKRCGLRNLNFDGNQLDGSLPRSLVNCGMLEVLDLSNNKIDDKFPYWLGSLPELQVLVLRSNKFHGFLQGSKANHSFPKLRIFDLSNNDFEGPFPTEYIESLNAMMNVNEGKSDLQYMGDTDYPTYDFSVSITMKGFVIEMEKILTIFTSIDLSENRFEGEIPDIIGKLSSLKGLNLSHNHLGGHIPPTMGNLTNLEWLDLSSNKLVGKIPEQLADMTFLAVLNLSHNQLVGSIPHGKQFNTFNNDSYEGNLGLCGIPLTKTCSNVEPPQPTYHEENNAESAFEFGWKVVVMGYGCGMVIGLAMGYLVFRTRKPKWFVLLVEGEQHHKAKTSKKNARRSCGRRN